MKSRGINTVASLLILQIFFSPNVRPQSDSGSAKDDKTRLCDTTFTLTIDPQLPQFRFHIVLRSIYMDAERESVKSYVVQELIITILDSQTQDTIQVIKDYPESDIALFPRNNLVDTVDINLDGYPDLSYVESTGATGNRGYVYYVYGESTHQFTLNDAFSGLVNPSLDYATKQIRTYEKCGAGCF